MLLLCCDVAVATVAAVFLWLPATPGDPPRKPSSHRRHVPSQAAPSKSVYSFGKLKKN